MKKFYVLQVEKFKSSDVVGVSKHNTRDFRNKADKHSKNDNVDFTRSKNNLSFGVKNSKEFGDKLEAIIRKDNPNQKIKTTTNVFVDFVISASPSYFFDALDTKEKLAEWDRLNNANPEDRKKIREVWQSLNRENFEAWKKGVLEFCNDEEFKDISISLDIHMDEKTPHAHFSVAPKVGSKLDCKHFYTPASLERWRAKLEGPFTPLGLERVKEAPGTRDDQEQHYKALAGATAPEQPPATQPPKKLTSKDVFEVKKNWYGQTEKVQVIPTEDVLKNSFEREKAQGEKYSFYKDFYEKNKFTALQVKKLENKNSALEKENVKIKKQIRKFTDEQMEGLRQVSLLDVVKQLGFEPKKEGQEFYRVKTENLNLVINAEKNQFSENKSSENGFGAINLLVQVFGYSPKQSIEYLSGKYSNSQITKSILASPDITLSVVNNAVEKINETPPKPTEKNLPYVLDYLERRGIDRDLATEYARQGLIYADSKRNLVICNPEKTFAVMRGTVTLKDGSKNNFKCNKGEADFIKFQNTDNPKNLYVFESAIDALAYQSLNPDAKGLFVSTNGSLMANRLGDLNPERFEKVFACFDNDEQGQKFTAKLKSNVSSQQSFEVNQPKAKDFAEDSQKNFDTQARANIGNSQAPKNSSGSQPLDNSEIRQSISSEKTLESIGSIENRILALGIKLSQVPTEQRAQLEKQIAELRMQLMRLQQQLEEEKKRELNRPKLK
jgi:hypothetical protein